MRVYGPDAIRRAVGFADLIEPVAAALAEYSRGRGGAPIAVFAPRGAEGDVHVKSAWLPGRPVFTVKVATWFAARAAGGLPAGSGFIAVHDSATGDLLALLQDEHHLTDVRTAAAGAVAARLLAPEGATSLAVLGTGVQAYLQALAVCTVRPIGAVAVWGRRTSAALRLRSALQAGLPGIDVVVAGDAEQAVRRADVVVTATGSRRPILRGSWLTPGQHVTAVGADDPGKAELDPDCFARADLLVVDSRADTPRLAGDLRRAIEAGAVAAADIGAELGELQLDRRARRTSADQSTIAKLIGLGVQDLAAAEVALLRLSRPDAEPLPRPAPASSRDLGSVAEGHEKDTG